MDLSLLKIRKIAKTKIFWIFVLGIAFRLTFSFFGTLELDFNTFVSWGKIVYSNGFAKFYNGWSDYLPGYIYILWLLTFISEKVALIPTTLLFKLPSMISDTITAYLIYKIVLSFTKKDKPALIASVFYLFNPAIFANSTLWGQVDSLTALFSLLSVYLASSSVVLSAVTLAIGTAIKPQAAFSLLAILFVVINKKWDFKKLLMFALSGLFSFALLFAPFDASKNLIPFIIKRIGTTMSQYPYSSVNAFNFWGIFGFWKKDTTGLLSPLYLGGAILLIVGFLSGIKTKNKKAFQYVVLSVVFLSNFLFFSRMHERHLLPVFAPLIVSAAIYSELIIPYFILSFTYLANLYYSFVWVSDQFREAIPDVVVKLLIALNLFSLYLILKNIFNLKEKSIVGFLGNLTKIKTMFLVSRKGEKKEHFNFPKVKISEKYLNIFLALILGFSFISRIIFLNKPDKEYFDEVYHAFTAQVMKHNDPKAWEWWNPHPEGFAYEWTHPPLAKLGMWAGMLVFGENPIGWRIPGALLGTLTVFLVYLISKELFKDKLVGVIASLVFSLDGLPLVMSRIGMNDSYFLLFTLLSLYLYIKDRYLFSSLAFGLALSSKWSALWAIPIFVVAHFCLKKKFVIGYLYYLLVPIVYMASYLPMYFVGEHNFKTFIDVTKQMWWYHTRLRAIHPYTSKWYEWPFLIRPIWLYTSGEINGRIANIYAFGNPFVFWMGFCSIVVSVYFALKEQTKRLGLVVFSYLIFFVLWAMSPRIMFLYHYLPSIPFMSIAAAYLFRRNPKYLVILIPVFIIYLYFFPHWTGISVPVNLDNSYYWFPTWR